MKRNVSVVKLCLYVSECVCSKIIKELPGLVGSGTLCILRALYDKAYFIRILFYTVAANLCTSVVIDTNFTLNTVTFIL